VKGCHPSGMSALWAVIGGVATLNPRLQALMPSASRLWRRGLGVVLRTGCGVEDWVRGCGQGVVLRTGCGVADLGVVVLRTGFGVG
jgi:hypothetical protein